MNVLKCLLATCLLSLLVACGGGGGNPGSSGITTGGTNGGGSTPTVVVTTPTPTLQVTVVNTAGAVDTSNSISGGLKRLKAVVKDGKGVPLVGKLVKFTVPDTFATLNPSSGTVLTDSNGVALLVIQPASFLVSGASTVSVEAQIGQTPLTASLGVQANSANVSFGDMVVKTPSLTAYQSTAVEVPILVDGMPAIAGQVSVNFTSACGSFAPATIATGSNGKVQTTFTATGCTGGSVTLNVSASGVSTFASTGVTVLRPVATNLQFVSATPQTIYSQQAQFGNKLSVVKFRLVDSGGNGIDGETIDLSLSGPALAAGVVFSDTGLTTANAATSLGGYVTMNIRSGDLPTPVAVNASMRANPAIVASSGGLAVNSGAPVQNFLSFSADIYNIEGWEHDGEISKITIFVADRLAQPVPDGTVLSFVAEGGQITASCGTLVNVNGKSGCSVSLQSQNFRPSNGRVTVLVYAEGLEPFTDLNGDNVYNSGEQFADLGQPFLDINENGIFDPASEQKIGNAASPGIGSSACAPTPASFGSIPPSVPNTCNGIQGKALIRAQSVFSFSSSHPGPLTLSGAPSRGGFRIILSDINGNAMPFGTTVEGKVSGGNSCSLEGVYSPKVFSTANPTLHDFAVTASDTGTCQGASVSVSVTTPKGIKTLMGSVTIP